MKKAISPLLVPAVIILLIYIFFSEIIVIISLLQIIMSLDKDIVGPLFWITFLPQETVSPVTQTIIWTNFILSFVGAIMVFIYIRRLLAFKKDILKWTDIYFGFLIISVLATATPSFLFFLNFIPIGIYILIWYWLKGRLERLLKENSMDSSREIKNRVKGLFVILVIGIITITFSVGQFEKKENISIANIQEFVDLLPKDVPELELEMSVIKTNETKVETLYSQPRTSKIDDFKNRNIFTFLEFYEDPEDFKRIHNSFSSSNPDKNIAIQYIEDVPVYTTVDLLTAENDKKYTTTLFIDDRYILTLIMKTKDNYAMNNEILPLSESIIESIRQR